MEFFLKISSGVPFDDARSSFCRLLWMFHSGFFFPGVIEGLLSSDSSRSSLCKTSLGVPFLEEFHKGTLVEIPLEVLSVDSSRYFLWGFTWGLPLRILSGHSKHSSRDPLSRFLQKLPLEIPPKVSCTDT